jgi:hypothetical protein
VLEKSIDSKLLSLEESKRILSGAVSLLFLYIPFLSCVLAVVKALGCNENIPVPLENQQSEEIEKPNNSISSCICEICNKSVEKVLTENQGDNTISCHICTLTFHVNCVSPKLQKFVKSWMCPYCTLEVRFFSVYTFLDYGL